MAKGEGIISTSIGRDTFWLIATWLMDHQIPIYLHSSLEAIRYFVTELERFPHIVYISSLNVELQNMLAGMRQTPSRLTIPSFSTTPFMAGTTSPSPSAAIHRQTETKHGGGLTSSASARPPPHRSSQGIAFGASGQGITFGPTATSPSARRHATPRFGDPGIPLAARGSPRVATLLGASPGTGRPLSSRANKRHHTETGFFASAPGSRSLGGGVGLVAQPRAPLVALRASPSSFSSPSSFAVTAATVSPSISSLGASSSSSLSTTALSFGQSPSARPHVVLDGVSFGSSSSTGSTPGDMDCSKD